MSNIPTFEEFKKQLELDNGQPTQQPQSSQLPQQPQNVEVNIQEIVNNFLKNNKVKILFGTPCYGGKLYTGYFQSMTECVVNLTKLGIKFEIMTIGNESLITRARNGIVAKFLARDDLTHLMFIDSDITFSWLSILRLLLSNKDVCGGCYPKKTLNWEKVKRNVTKNTEINNKELIARSVDYVFNPVYFQENGNVIIKVNNGMIKVKDVATGFMMVKKNVFQTMKYKYPEFKYKNNVAGYHDEKVADNFYTFFDTEIDEESQVYLSEDYFFCKYWSKCGGELYLDLNTNLNHTGIMDYNGCLALTINEVDDLNQDTKVTGNTIVNK